MSQPANEKPCCRCGGVKSLSDFTKDTRQLDGRRNVCKNCARVDPEKNRARAKAWGQANPAKAKAQARKWAAANIKRRREIGRESRKRRYHANIEQSRRYGREAVKRFSQLNPTAYRAIRKRSNEKQKAIRRGATATGRISYERIKRRDGMKCHICRRSVKVKELEFDHVIPLVAGGTHTEDNIAVSHRRCNRSKAGKVLTLF